VDSPRFLTLAENMMPPVPRPPASRLLQETLRVIVRRYRLPAITEDSAPPHNNGASTTLAIVIEQTRLALLHHKTPDPALKQGFLNALAQLIGEAMHPELGDPVFQALVLQHRSAPVREHAALAAHHKQDRRRVRTLITRIAHPAKQQHVPAGPLQDALPRLQAAASAAAWVTVDTLVNHLLALPESEEAPSLREVLLALQAHPALTRLQRLDALDADACVQRYQALLDRNGPRSGSVNALRQGLAAQRRGAAVEAVVSEALEVLAQRLNDAEPDTACYRVVTSMRVPPSLPGSPERAKTEWDSVLLQCGKNIDEPTEWDVCLLVEAKASADAASSDLPRVRRGLHLLAQADEETVYPFKTQQGLVNLRGASLRTLDPNRPSLADIVLYCSNAPSDGWPRLLSAASRMQLLSEAASLQFASALAEQRVSSPDLLEPLWPLLLSSPRLSAVLHQYPLLREARDLMVHPDDLLAAVKNVTVNA